MSYDLGSQGIYTGGWDNAWGMAEYEGNRFQREEADRQERAQAYANQQQASQQTSNSSSYRYSSNLSYDTPVYKLPELPKLTPEEEAELQRKIEQENQIREAAIEAYEEQLAQRKVENKRNWAAWWNMSTSDKLARVWWNVSPAQNERRLNKAITRLVENHEQGELRKECYEKKDTRQVKFCFQLIERCFNPLNRLSERLIPPVVFLILSLLITVCMIITVIDITGHYWPGAIMVIPGLYSLNILKVGLVWSAMIFFAFIFKLGELWEDFLYSEFFENLVVGFKVLLAICMLGGSYWLMTIMH